METEITVQVFNTLEEIKDILSSQGFEIIENYQLNDWYFTKYEDISKMSYIDLLNNSFLIRQIVTDKEEIQICYKKKTLDDFGNVISEEKTYTTINDLKKILKIFEMVNFNNYCVIKNHSYVYKKENLCFALQIIENLGIFIEYEEDETMTELSPKLKFNYMCDTIQKLGLKFGQDYSCKKVYMKIKNK